MRRVIVNTFIAAIVVTVLILALAARGDTYIFPVLRLGKGYAGPVTIDVTWASGEARNVTGCTGSLKAYSVPPSGGTGGTVLWTKTITPTGTPTNRASVTLTGTDTATPGTYYSELTLTEAGITDALHSQIVIEGR